MSQPLPSSFTEAERRLGRRPQKKLCYATWLIRGRPDEIALRHHATDIVTFHRDGRVVVSVDGWQTVTTKWRLKAILLGLGWDIWSDRSVWWLAAQRGPRYRFEDGVTLDAAGGISLKPAPLTRLRTKLTLDDLPGRSCGHVCTTRLDPCCQCTDRWWRCPICTRRANAKPSA